MVKLIINGICGHMGQAIMELALNEPEKFHLIGGVDCIGTHQIGNVPVYPNWDTIPQKPDVVIDFSMPQALLEVLSYCEANGVAIVVGTTGLGKAEQALLERAATKIPVFRSGNMSIGTNLQIELIKKAAATLGENFDVEIIEAHHNRKIDSPSGTALMLADAVKSQYPLPKEYVYGRRSKNHRRTKREIGIHALRGGTVTGVHTVYFLGQHEVIEVTHRAESRQVFAAGSLRAALYVTAKPPGQYDMHNIVTEKDILSHIYTEGGQAIITLSSLPTDPSVIKDIFELLAENQVFVDMISVIMPSGESGDVSFSLPSTQLDSALNALKHMQRKYLGMDVYTLMNITKLTVEGPGMALRHGIAAQLFSVMADVGVQIELVTTSETTIACCIKTHDVPAAVAAIQKHFDV